MADDPQAQFALTLFPEAEKLSELAKNRTHEGRAVADLRHQASSARVHNDHLANPLKPWV